VRLTVTWVDCDGSAGRDTHCDVDDAPNSALSVFFENGSDLCGIGQVTSVRIDHGAVLFLVGRVFREGGLCDLIETSESGRK